VKKRKEQKKNTHQTLKRRLVKSGKKRETEKVRLQERTGDYKLVYWINLSLSDRVFL
jgi:hypothetical protein